MKKELLSFLKEIKAFSSSYFDRYDTKIPYIITCVIALLIFIVSFTLFIELTEDLQSDILATYDSSISQTIVNFRTPFLTKYFLFVTNVGDSLGYAIVFSLCTILFYLFLKSWKYVAQIALVMVLALSSNLILKQIINRARPTAEHLVTVETLSYPSGHAMMAMAFYGFLVYLISELKMNKIIKYGLISLLMILILSIGISRIYIGVHFPSDIAGGFIAGFIWVVFCIIIFNLIKIFKRDPATSV